MTKEFSRSRRVAAQIQRELADLVRNELKDPRIEMVTINAVGVSRDLTHAKVYVTVLGQEAQRALSMVDILNQASSFLRRMLMQRMHIRTIPQLNFIYDESIERGARLTTLIDQAVMSDVRKKQ